MGFISFGLPRAGYGNQSQKNSRHDEVHPVTITRVGTNQKYADGWDTAFAGKRGGTAAKKATKKPIPSKKAGPKKSGKKGKK